MWQIKTISVNANKLNSKPFFIKMNNNFIIRLANPNDLENIFALYKRVAGKKGGIAREVDEITEDYIANNLKNSSENGICLVIAEKENPDRLIAELHCYKLKPRVFKHILSELTVVVCPAFQGQGLGKMLFEQLIFLVESERNDILRIELIARESNQKAIGLYQRLGFVIEGRLEKRIYANGKFEADIPMVWFNQKYIG